VFKVYSAIGVYDDTFSKVEFVSQPRIVALLKDEWICKIRDILYIFTFLEFVDGLKAENKPILGTK
jgi:hypothetical protein